VDVSAADVNGVPCVVSVAEHAGWAHLVSVATSGAVPMVIDRRRVTLIDAGLPTMPYHHDSIDMAEAEANALIAAVRSSIATNAARALEGVIGDLSPTHSVVAVAIRKPPFAELPPAVAAVRASYPLQCAADGMMYQLAICRAARDLDLAVHAYPRGLALAGADTELGTAPGELERFVSRTGRPPGPPWTLEHQRAYAGGIAALAAHIRQAVRIPARSE
jgi:hypothetical protein